MRIDSIDNSRVLACPASPRTITCTWEVRRARTADSVRQLRACDHEKLNGPMISGEPATRAQPPQPGRQTAHRPLSAGETRELCSMHTPQHEHAGEPPGVRALTSAVLARTVRHRPVLATRRNDTRDTTRCGQARADNLVAALPARSWQRISFGAALTGPRDYDSGYDPGVVGTGARALAARAAQRVQPG